MSAFLRLLALAVAARWLRAKLVPAPVAAPPPPPPAPPSAPTAGAPSGGINVLMALAYAVGLLGATGIVAYGVTDLLLELGVERGAGEASVELYKLTAQIIPTLLIAVSIEVGVRWATDPQMVREQAGAITAIGIVAMVGFGASLYAVATNAGSDVLFWFTCGPTAILATFVVGLPAFPRG